MVKIIKRWFERYFADEEALILLLLIGLGLTAIVTMGDILAPVLASIILAFLMQGMSSSLMRHGVSQAVAFTVSFVLFVGGFFTLMLVIIPLAWNQATLLLSEFPGMLEQAQQAMNWLMQNYPEIVSAEQVSDWMSLINAQIGHAGQVVLSFSISNLPALVALLIYLILVPILVFFFLKDRAMILQWLSSFLPQKRPLMSRIWVEMNEQCANYVRGKVIEILIVGGVTYITFVLFGMNYAALLGLLVGLSVLIPYIGAAVVTIPVALIAYFQWGFGGDFFWVFGLYLFIQALDGNVLVPLLFSEAVNLHPVAIILAVLVFGGFWGFWGVFFAIPLATLIKAMLTAWPKGLSNDELQALNEQSADA